MEKLLKDYKIFLQKLKEPATSEKVKKYSSVYGKFAERKYKEYILPYQFTKREIAQIYNLRAPIYLDVRITIKEQMKILKEFLKIPVKKDCKLLSLGSGAGVLEVFLAEEVVPKGKVTGIDISSKLVNLARSIAKKKRVKNVKFLVQDMEKMKFESNSFDIVFSFDVFHWVKNLEKVFSKVKEILNKNGYFLFAYGPKHSYLKEKEAVRRLKEIGFKNITLSHIRFKHPNPALPHLKNQIAVRPLIKARK